MAKMKYGLLGFAAAVAAAITAPAAAAPLKYKVIRTGVVSMAANMALIEGEKEAILVDVPFARSDAYRVVAEILDSGKTLKAIFITHDHPDHFFGLDVLNDAFPDARIIAHPVAVKDVARSVPIKFKRWGEMLGNNAPRRPMVPVDAGSNIIELEGHKLEILGPMQGDHVRSTALWDPETRTLIAGDILYNNMFVWLGEHTPQRYNDWLAVLDRLEAMKPALVIPGHTKPGVTDDSTSFAWTRGYIRDFIEARKKAKSSAELAAAINTRYPGAVDVYNGFLLGVSAQVGAGEIPPWDE